ncbi:hypothetical protein DM02DRAFT_631633 [Periconia macrospinosa]|uniref:Uncharacterized protein n=1 Tax=Periconia macrospinosa TaxID=97972 RepID=A0A2V1DFK0_9PLEO|nr:hypothetical protein DM02DRAFT_631633 [Periconia macrospinosa]
MTSPNTNRGNRRNTISSTNRRNTTGTGNRRGSANTRGRRSSANAANVNTPRANTAPAGLPPTELILLSQVDATQPNFLSLGDWQNVLQPLTKKTFVLENAVDLETLSKLIKSSNIPRLDHAITSISLPKLFWFSGVRGSRTENETLEFLTELPALTHLQITLHTAGLTKAKWSEFQQNSIEQYDVVKSKQRVPLTVDEVVQFYDLQKICKYNHLRFLRIQCYDSAIVRQQTPSADPLAVFFELREWLTSAMQGRTVVDLVVNPGERE